MPTGCWGICPTRNSGPRAAEAVALLALIAGQDVEPVEGSDGTDGRWRIAQRVAPDRVISTVDPEARHAHKTVHRRQDGFKAHVAVEPDTGIITDCALTKASGPDTHDAAVAAQLLADEDDTGDGAGRFGLRHRRFPGALGRGQACRSGQIRARCARRCRAVSPSMTSSSTTPPGLRPAQPSITRAITARGYATFGVACRGCPLRAQCTTSATGKSSEDPPARRAPTRRPPTIARA